MSAYNDSGLKTFTAGAAIAQHSLVKLAAGVLTVAGVGDRPIGTLEEASGAADQPRTVRLFNCPGTRKMIASGAITLHAVVYLDAAGKITATVGGDIVGMALGAATADGDIIEVLPLEGNSLPADMVAALAGTPTGTPTGTIVDVADIALSTSDVYTDTSVNTAINTAILAVNLQAVELQTTLNATLAKLKAAGLMATS
ncbi:MAG: DUF2190 family protein [Phycisphaeraceae bacterium]|nr:DUF2190 family protein [Phycisphaeraceae bacterium]